MNSVEKCFGNVEKAVDPEHLKTLSKEPLEKELLGAFDIDNNKEIKWSEFHIAAQTLKKQPKNLRALFRFFDKDHNWRISHKEL